MSRGYVIRRLEAAPEPTERLWIGQNRDELRRMQERGGFRTKETKVKNRSWNERKRRARV